MSKTKVPAIPAPTDANLKEVARAIKGVVDVREGLIGDPLDANVTFRDLKDGGIISVSTVSRGGGSGSVIVTPPVTGGDGYDPVGDLTPPPAPTGFTATGGLTSIFLEWDAPTYPNHAYAEIWRSETNVIGNAERVGTSVPFVYSDPVGRTGTLYYYWVRFVSQANVEGPYHGVSGLSAGTGRIGNVDLNPLIVEAGNLASGAVTATKIAAGAVDLTKFANSIEPITVVTGALPTTKSTSSIYRTDDGKLYRWNGTAYVASVPAVDVIGQLTNSQLQDIAAAKITGQVVASQIADASMTVAKFASGIEPLTIITGALPTTKSTNTIFRTDDGKTYRWNGTAYIASVPATDITGTVTNAQIEGLAASKVTGQLTNSQIQDVEAAKLTGQLVASQIADASITTAKFAAGIEPVEIVSSLPTTGNFQGRTAFLTTDNKLYRHTGSAWTVAVDGADIVANSVVAGKIAAGAIGASEIAAGAIRTDKLFVSGRGSAINDDPHTSDASAWPSTGLWGATWTIATVTDGPAGSTVIRANAAAPASYAGARQIAFNPSKAYRVRCKARSVGSNGTFYLVVDLRDAAGSVITGDGTAWFYPASGVTVPAAWTDYEGQFGFGTSRPFPSTARTMSVGALMNYNATAGYHEVQDLRIEEMADASLIVDGAVVASKVAAGAVTTAKLAAGAVTADTIAANAITAAKIEAGAITTAKLAAGAVTATEIAAGTITGENIAANTITGGNIAADTITAGQIAAGAISASEIAAGAISTDKLLVTGRGAALNDDPNTQDVSAWTGSGLSIITDSTSPAGNTVLRCAAAGSTVLSRRIALDPTRNHQFRIWTRQETGSSTTYLTVAFSDANDNIISGGASGWSQGTYHYFGLTNGALPAAWTEYRISFGPNEPATIPAGARYIRVGVLSNYTGSGTQLVTGVRLMLKADADLIVDGAIVASKIAAGSVITEKLAAGAVTADTIATNAITAIKIESDAITADKIAANAVTADEIAANAITTGKIAAGAVSAAQIAAGAITTDKLLVTGRGSALNDDPGCQDASNWQYGGHGDTATRVTISDGVFGSNAFRSTTGTASSIDTAKLYPVSAGKKYRLSAWFRRTSDANGLVYLRLVDQDGNQLTFGGLEGQTPPTSWQKIATEYTPSPSQKSVRIRAILNWASSAGYHEVTDLRLEEKAEADLIVDGAIIATKLAANAIAVGTAAIQNGAIVNAMIGFAAIDEAKIADASITTAKIGDAQITNAKIGGTIQSDNYSAGSAGWAISKSNGFAEFGAASIRGQLTASQIDSRGLTVRDNAGNILLGVGNPLDFANVGGSTRPANNATVGAVAGTNLIDSNGRTISDKRVLGNLLDSTTWVPDSSGSQPGFSENGTSSGGANYIAYDTLPDGSIGNLWRARSGSAAGTFSEGGWNSSVFNIDHTRMYRFSVWIRPFGGNASGSFYLGVANVSDIGGGPNSNPYFVADNRNVLPDSQWVLVVGYVFPSGYSGGQNNRSGVYRASDGVKFRGGTDFKWVSGATWTYHRTYQYYTNQANNYQDFWNPRVDLMDGTEPSLDALLAGGKAYAASLTSTWSGVSSRPANLSSLSGGEAIQNSQISVSGGAISGIGTGNGTAVANNAITVSGGAISGIGSGDGTAVANNAITVSGGVLNGIGTSNVQVDNSYQAIGQNLIPNSDWTQTITMVMGWNPNGATWHQTLAYASIVNGWAGEYILRSNTTRNVWLHQQGPTSGGDDAVAVDLYPLGDWGNNTLPVVGGQRYCLSAYLQSHRCKGGVGFVFYDRYDNWLTQHESGPVSLPYGGAAALTQYQRVSAIAVAPSNAAAVRLYIRKYNTWSSENNSYFWIAAPQFEAVSANAPGPSPYVAGPPLSVGQLGYTGDLAANRTFIDGAGTIQGVASGGGTAVANSNITVDGSGTIQGIGSGAGTAVANSNITISGGAIQGIGSGAGTAVANSNITISGGAISGIGSGTGTVVANSNISVSTSTGAISGIGSGDGQSVANNVDSRILSPAGGTFTTSSSSLSGALRIRLPARLNTDYPMVKFTVEIYEYITNYSTTLTIGGHVSGSAWYNESAQLVAGNIEYPVYFGHDGTYFVVWIGNAGETWSYPQVFISNVFVGYTSMQASLWASNWAISFDTGGAANVSRSVLDTYPAADWSKTARRPANLAGLSGTEAIQNSQISIGSNGALSGAGGGQVTIGGLGYSGDLNATLGATSANLRVGVGANLVANSDFAISSAPWGVAWVQNGGSDVEFARNIAGDPWRPVNGHNIGVRRFGNALTGVIDISVVGDVAYYIPVIPGQRYELSAYVAAHRTDVDVRVWWFDASNAYVGEAGTIAGRVSGGTNLANWWRPSTFAVAPSNARSARIGVRMYAADSGQSDAYCWVTRFFFGEANAGQWDPSPWSAAGVSTVNQLGFPMNSNSVPAYIAEDTINITQFGSTIQTTNFSSTAGWRITKSGTATFNNANIRGEINGGSYTGYAWPPAGTWGFHLGPNGLLLGNANNGRYFQVTNDGQIYAPGFTVVNGSATFSGTLSGAIVNTDQIVGGAAASASSSTSTGASTSVVVTVPANASALLIEYYLGPPTFSPGAGGDKYGQGGTPDVYGPVLTGLTANGSTIGSITVTPSPGTYTIAVSRSFYTGTMRLGVIVLKR